MNYIEEIYYTGIVPEKLVFKKHENKTHKDENVHH